MKNAIANYDEIEATAAKWLARQDAATLSGAEQAELDAWLNAATANRVSYLRLKAAWHRTDRLKAAEQLFDSAAVTASPAPSLRWQRWPQWAAAASVIVGAFTALSFWWVAPPSYESMIGQINSVPLADGSQAILNTNSQISVVIDGEERSIELTRGEAFFDVAHDASRPFTVQAGHYAVVALGTQFSVRFVDDEIRVSVLEGTVRIDSTDNRHQPVQLTAGQVRDASDGVVVVTTPGADEVAERLAWREGWLIFRDRPLAEVAAEFQRYNDTTIVIADGETANLTVSGTFRTHNLAGFLRLLEQGFGVEVAHENRRVVLATIPATN